GPDHPAHLRALTKEASRMATTNHIHNRADGHHPAIDESRFEEYLWVLDRRATPGAAGDHLRAHIRVIRDEWQSGGHHRDRAIHLLLESLMIEVANMPAVSDGA